MFFPGDGNFDHSLWQTNGSGLAWSTGSVDLSVDEGESDSASSSGGGVDPWGAWGSAFGPDLYDLPTAPATPKDGIQCTPAPG